MSGLRETIDGLWERGELDPGPIEEAIALLDSRQRCGSPSLARTAGA